MFVTRNTHKDLFYVIGIGGSAGGLAAFCEFLSNLPSNLNAAVVVVQHLMPKAKSDLAKILSSKTVLAVKEAADGEKVMPRRIYVIPPNKNIEIKGDKLILAPRRAGVNLPIDEFFNSLAVQTGRNAIGVVLSGSGTDGTQGLRAIRQAGGLTFAQDSSSEFSTMPDSAKEAGVTDYVLSPAEIAKKIIYLVEEGAVKKDEDGLSEIIALMLGFRGVDFTYYKPGTIRRRIKRRMLLNRITNYYKYAEYLKKNPAEATTLYQDLLINVTNFFRDPEFFDYLKQKIFPKLLSGNPESLRIWIPGCSTGEEVYSLAIILAELAAEQGSHPTIQIFGTDISEEALKKARLGIYSKNIQSSVSPLRLSKFFLKTGSDKYQISKSLRAMCVFARHNMIADTPFSKLDIVSCRNVLIYLDSHLQKKVFPIFHFALKPDGILVLGSAETASNFQDLFRQMDKKLKIYVKKNTPNQPHIRLLGISGETGVQYPNMATLEPKREIDIEKEADRLYLKKKAGAGLIINDNLTIVQFRGEPNRYLEPAQGRATLDLLKMAKKKLLPKILEALAETKKKNTSVKKTDHYLGIEIEIMPLGKRSRSSGYFLILFKERTRALPAKKVIQGRKESGFSARESLLLQKELEHTIEQLQTVIESRDGSNEELKSAHEELMSTNEELQSMNEELETTKEELQSANEELMTLNTELLSRNTDLEKNQKELYRKDEFLSFLGHELRNPLSPIIHSLELIKLHGVEDKELKNLLGIIDHQTIMMNDLVKQLLDSARAIGGKIELQLELTDFIEVAKHALEASRPLIDNEKQNLSVTYPKIPLRTLLDPWRTEQIIVNLLNNAAKYTKSGGNISVTISQHKQNIELKVKDSGIGISEETMPLIFDLFAQANQQFSNFKGGLGVGLMLSKTLAELHGGTLTASSAGKNKGSEFILRLPIRGRENDSGAVFRSATLEKTKLKRKKIFIVDDNKTLADVFGKLLGALGQDVSSFSDGASAVKATQKEVPEIMFIDIAMPEMSGYDLVKILRKDERLKKAKLIALSGFGDESREKALKAGFDNFVVKPITGEQLVKIISE
ncbi:response regulator [Candidatus Giovannonibacteria bacterium]|nr:response regulator [Candidatus Giovannonibacteria bacterium]